MLGLAPRLGEEGCECEVEGSYEGFGPESGLFGLFGWQQVGTKSSRIFDTCACMHRFVSGCLAE